MAELSQELEQPLSTLVHESQQLADTLLESRILDRLQALRGQATASAELVQQLMRLARPAGTAHIDQSPSRRGVTIGIDGRRIERLHDRFHLGPSRLQRRSRDHRPLIPTVAGLCRRVSGNGRSSSSPLRQNGRFGWTRPTLFPVASATHVHLDITETEAVNPSGRILPSLTDTLDVHSLYRLAGALGATLDVSAPASGPFRMIVRLPTGHAPASLQPQVIDAAAIERTAEAPSSVSPSADQDLATTARTERRSNARIQTALPAKITRGSSVWEGTVMNVSVSGAWDTSTG